jgi:hypothetical protein
MPRIIISGVLLLILFTTACRKNKCHDEANPACDNYNPCSTAHTLSADFSIYENDCTQGPGAYDTSWHYYPTDTISTNCATFTVNDTTVDSVRWQIGAGTYTKRSFYLNFTGQRLHPVPITLTVYKDRNSCYPMDDTVKTLTKTLYFTDTCLAFGSYRGYFDNNILDTGTVTIKYVNEGPAPYPNIIVAGFVKGCSDYYCCSGHGIGSISPFYLGLNFGSRSLGSCNGVGGSLYYNPNNDSAFAVYTFSLGGTPPHQFRGIKNH